MFPIIDLMSNLIDVIYLLTKGERPKQGGHWGMCFSMYNFTESKEIAVTCNH
jgi:hypothetical protein